MIFQNLFKINYFFKIYKKNEIILNIWKKLDIKNLIKRTRKNKEKELLKLLESYMNYIKFDRELTVVYLNYDIYLKHKIKKYKELIPFLELILNI